MKVQVKVFPRKGVRDPQGEAVLDKLRRLDWLELPVNQVAVGRVLLLDIDTKDPNVALATVSRMCKEFLANEIVEDFEIKLSED